MKKILSILIALLLVVSLGLAMTVPVLAGGDDWILTVAETYTLTISSTDGGSVADPGEGSFMYHVGMVVNLVATPATGYGFVNWAGNVDTIANVNSATTTITMQGNYNVTAKFLAGAVAAKTETATNSTVDAIAEADIVVVVKGTATITIAKFAGNPHPPSGGGAPVSLDLLALDTFSELNIFRDVSVSGTTPETEIEIDLYYTGAQVEGFNETSLQIFWFNGTNWEACSSTGVNTTDVTISNRHYSGYMWAKIKATGTMPSLAALQGTEFGGYGHPSETPQPWCFIATAAYGTATAKEIDILREFRDTVLLSNSLGAKFVYLYYKTSPPIANFISQHEVLRTVVRVGFVDPVVKILSLSHDLW